MHPGHIYLISEAAKLGEVHVIVATDKNRELYSGTKPIIPEQQRLEVVSNIKNVASAKLGRHDNDTLKTVQEFNPDLILLGPDQKFSVEKLSKALKSKGMEHVKVMRLEKYYNKYELHSSSLIKKKIVEQYVKNHESDEK
ncbi:MAG: adenylyltransferase/cytidyltransferase family protein [Candidatus Lokiarchaeota archaeon]|nr:adenylyltransferase/cytidyltransferase family protein [Candidatus Lokiarchaeota archaeon]